MSYFVDIFKLIQKFIWKGKRPRTVNTILRRKNKIRGLTLLSFTAYFKASIIKATCDIGKRMDKYINATEETTKKHTHINTANSYLTKKQRQHNGVKTVSSTNGARTGYHKPRS